MRVISNNNIKNTIGTSLVIAGGIGILGGAMVLILTHTSFIKFKALKEIITFLGIHSKLSTTAGIWGIINGPLALGGGYFLIRNYRESKRMSQVFIADDELGENLEICESVDNPKISIINSASEIYENYNPTEKNEDLSEKNEDLFFDEEDGCSTFEAMLQQPNKSFLRNSLSIFNRSPKSPD